MSAIPTLLADAVTAVLAAAVTAQSFDSLTAADMQSLEIRRSYPDWDDDFRDLKSLAVDVVFVSSGASGGDLVELDTEATLNTDPAVDVAVRYRFSATDKESGGRLKNTSVDKLVHLVEELYELLAAERMQSLTLAAGLSANWLDTSVRTYCDYRKLREGLFLGVVRVRYDASKAG
jgi:hypothetical protein